MKISNFKVLVFDCYGTLIDWESGMMKALTPLTDNLNGKFTRNEILEAHARYESWQQAQTPHKRYQELLATVYRRLSEEWGIPATWSECEQYGNSVKHWPAFPDTVKSLRYLKQHFKLAIISNVDNKSFAESNKKLGVEFDAIYTAEDIGSYKPADTNFEYMLSMLKSLGYEKTGILHTAESMFHDHVPANRHGLKSCWIYRRYGQDGFGATMDPGNMPHYDFKFTSMKEMVDAHKSEINE